jgi:hypothetical protein
MLIEQKTDLTGSLPWPERYYKTENIAERESMLDEVLKSDPSEDDLRRKELLKKRYRQNRNRDDLFMEAWLMITVAAKDSVGLLSRGRKERELKRLAEQLMITSDPDPVLREEWKDFAGKWISSCLGKQYRSAAFGLFTMKDRQVAQKIANEINAVSRDYPAVFSLEDSFREFRKTLIEVFRETIDVSDEYWK